MVQWINQRVGYGCESHSALWQQSPGAQSLIFSRHLISSPTANNLHKCSVTPCHGHQGPLPIGIRVNNNFNSDQKMNSTEPRINSINPENSSSRFYSSGTTYVPSCFSGVWLCVTLCTIDFQPIKENNTEKLVMRKKLASPSVGEVSPVLEGSDNWNFQLSFMDTSARFSYFLFPKSPTYVYLIVFSDRL